MLTDRFKRGLVKPHTNQILIASLGWLARCGIPLLGKEDGIYDGYLFKNCEYIFKNWRMRIEYGEVATFSSHHYIISSNNYLISIIPSCGRINQYAPVYEHTLLDDPGLYRVLKLLKDCDV